MVLNHMGCKSNEESLPGGGPQGTKLGLFLVLILINNAGYKPNQICTSIGEHLTQPKLPIERAQHKYVDDMTQCAVINLKELIEPDQNPNKDVLRQYHERTGHVLPVDKNPIQAEVNKLKIYKNKIKW